MRKTIADRSFFATGILDTQNTESPKMRFNILGTVQTDFDIRLAWHCIYDLYSNSDSVYVKECTATKRSIT
jgi:hypothetical protein